MALGRRSRSSFVSPAASSSPARVRSRVCSSSFGGGARLCPGDFGVAEELTALWNKVSLPCLRPDGVLLRRFRRGRRVLHRRPGLALHRLCQVTFVLPFLLLLDMEVPVGSVDGGRLDLGLSFLGGGGRRWRCQIWELDGLGRVPGRWRTAVGLIPSSMMGVSFDSTQSLCVMGFVQLEVLLGFFGGGDGRR